MLAVSIMRSILLIPALGLAACGPAAQNDAATAARTETISPAEAAADRAPAAPTYLVRGEPHPNGSPGWAAVMRGDRLLLDSPTSAGWYAALLDDPQVEAGRRTFTTELLTLTIEPGACAFREVYPALPDRVRLAWDSGRFEGCGGPRTPPAGIAGTRWELVRLDDEPAPGSRSPAATLLFGEDGGLGGTLACNDGGLRSTWTARGGFVANAAGFEQTAMGCNDPGAEAFGGRFWNALRSARAWRRDGERLFITFADGTEAELHFLL